MSTGAGIEITTATTVNVGNARGPVGSGSSASAAQASGHADFRDKWQSALASLDGNAENTTNTDDASKTGSSVASGAGKGTTPSKSAARTTSQAVGAGSKSQAAPSVEQDVASNASKDAQAAGKAQIQAEASQVAPVTQETSSSADSKSLGKDKSKVEGSGSAKADKTQKAVPATGVGTAVTTVATGVSVPVPIPTAPMPSKVNSATSVDAKAQGQSDSSAVPAATMAATLPQKAGTAVQTQAPQGAFKQALPEGTLSNGQAGDTATSTMANSSSVTSDPSTNSTVSAAHEQAQTAHQGAAVTNTPMPVNQASDPHAQTYSESAGSTDAQKTPAAGANTSAQQIIPNSNSAGTSATSQVMNASAAMSSSQSANASSTSVAAQSAASMQGAPAPAPAAAPAAAKPGSARPAAVQGLAERTANRVQPTADEINHDPQFNMHQAAGSGQDSAASLLVHDGTNSAGTSAQGVLGHSQTTEAGTPTASDMFNALDGENGAPNATWIHASARHAEAGYLDPSLGWIGVRADSTGGTLHASLVAGSSVAAQALSSHLEGLNKFLNEQQGTPATVTVANSNSYSFGQSGGQSLNQGSTPQQGGGQNGSSTQQTLPGVRSWRNAVQVVSPVSSSAASAVNNAPSAQASNRISVIA